ncbi:T9SS type A sorting domain-containing protein [Epilithonimonas hispanica]|uniref:Secretion system C-terminal sorting domain-containing protein n=1 Tax=Epilithonimonas hispanica TaxID=358687 RepID=A0A3D9CZS8_9FLAO|nr:T9SS type A sorting domain-containing protein [Epilithonimonas hispanica]REC71269.1 hypothetical protein DRF58_06975 [Epilithonimonas hispanica]
MKKLFLLSFFIPFAGMSQWSQEGSNIGAVTYGNQIGGGYLGSNSDGSIIVVGAHGYSSNTGQVRVLKFQNNDWVKLGSSLNGDNSGDFFGWATSISKDGYTIAVGAFYNDNYMSDAGEVKVFHYDGTDWVQVGSNIYGEAKNDYHGRCVSISADGSVVAVGVNNNGIGKARIYRFNGTSWVKIGGDIVGTGNGDQFGRSISINSEGNIVAVGANQNSTSATSAGQVRVFKLSDNNTWEQLGQSLNGTAASDSFGISVDLDKTGEILAVGANTNDDAGSNAGQIKVYKLSSNLWQQVGGNINGDAAGDSLGWGLSLSDDGNTLAAGAYLSKVHGTGSGQVKVLKFSNNSWNIVGEPLYGTTNNFNLGKAVALNSDGKLLLASSPAGAYSVGFVQAYKYTDPVMGVSDFNEKAIAFYPNPARENLTVTNAKQDSDYSIYNLAGQKLISGKVGTGKIPVQKLAKGNYLLVLTEGGKNKEAKFIKQ